MNDPYPEYREQLLDALEGEEFESVLEIGCGEGANLEAIKNKYPKVKRRKIEGIDSDKSRVEIARTKGLKVKLARGEDKIFPDKSFDIVFTYAVLIYNDLETTKKIIQNMIDYAKKKIIIIEMGINNNDEEIEETDGRYFARNYPELLKEFGLTGIKQKEIPKHIWPGETQKFNGYVIEAKIVV